MDLSSAVFLLTAAARASAKRNGVNAFTEDLPNPVVGNQSPTFWRDFQDILSYCISRIKNNSHPQIPQNVFNCFYNATLLNSSPLVGQEMENGRATAYYLLMVIGRSSVGTYADPPLHCRFGWTIQAARLWRIQLRCPNPPPLPKRPPALFSVHELDSPRAQLPAFLQLTPPRHYQVSVGVLDSAASSIGFSSCQKKSRRLARSTSRTLVRKRRGGTSRATE